MPRIRTLPEPLISQIAAGEVVERPASVVKELVENALDADARRIEVELAGGGRELIRVRDDGVGMEPEDACLAFARHATSKIASFEDLQKASTLGFRGEALASIASVSRTELLTAAKSGEGTLVRGADGAGSVDGAIAAARPASAPRGTEVTVRSLFFNVPARRKFLKTANTELRRALEVVQGYALARPDVHFYFSGESRVLLDAPSAGDREEGVRGRVGQIFGQELAAGLTQIVGGTGAAGESIWGLVGNRSTTRGRRYFIYVNRRLVRDRAILAVFYRAVREIWGADTFPALFLFVDLPAPEVDVNVHPQKAEVRFRDGAVVGRVNAALREALGQTRGAEGAPLSPLAPVESIAGAPLAWAGKGGHGSEVAEPWRIADVAYAPLERPPVPLSGRTGELRSFRLLGQYKGTIFLLEGPDGLYLIDQHVAHERVLYERFRLQLEAEKTASQPLLTPILLELSAAEALRLEQAMTSLEAHGFELRSMSANTLAVTAMPSSLTPGKGGELLKAFAQGSFGDDSGGDLRRRLLDSLAASMACRAAVKMHEPLGAEAIETVVSELFAAQNPYACPHGRPTVLKMSDLDLERHFGRR